MIRETSIYYLDPQRQPLFLTDPAKPPSFETTHIYDRNNHLLYDFQDHQQNQDQYTYIHYKDFPRVLVDAVVASGGTTFWSKSGDDFLRAIYTAISKLQSQQAVESDDATMQKLINSLALANQAPNPQLKMREERYTYDLVQQLPKWKIMEIYVNTIYYGDLNYGIEMAARDYYGLNPLCTHMHCQSAAAQLDLAQVSMLAGLPQNPSLYNPIMNEPAAIQRQNVVLQSMLDMGMITKQQMAQAQKETANYKFTYHSVNNTPQAPHFVRYVIDQVLVPLLGAQNVEDGGYNIYTTLDLDLEKKVEQAVYNHLYQPQTEAYVGYGVLSQTNNVNNGAAVVMKRPPHNIMGKDG